MKIVIPMAGLGKRLGPLTQRKPKALVRLGNKRLLDQVLDTFQELENLYPLEYVFITGYLGEQIKEYMKENYPDKKVTYYVQEKLIGQSHAVYLAREAISGPALLTYCDTINRIDFSFLELGNMGGIASVHEVENPRRHGIAVVGTDNVITKLVEKPKTMDDKLALTGLYYFSEGKALIQAIETQMQRGISLNNEYYLADAINILIEDGMEIKTEKVFQWLDAGTPEAILETNAHLLQSNSAFTSQAVSSQSNVIIPPVYIDESSYVGNSVIGPNVSIGKNCSISGSILKNTIVDDNSVITDAMMVNSLIGRGCSVSGNHASLILADQDGKRICYTTEGIDPAG